MILLVFAISLVVIAEMFNTAIEKTIDMITDEYHPLAKIAKDVAAGGVLIASLNSVAKLSYDDCRDGISNTFSITPNTLGNTLEKEIADFELKAFYTLNFCW